MPYPWPYKAMERLWQPDILYSGTGNYFTLARYNSDGSLDAGFDGDGKVHIPFIYNGTYSSAIAQSVAIQSDGKIVAAGRSDTGTGYDFTLGRYNIDGSLDAGFDGDGKVQTPFIFSGTNGYAYCPISGHTKRW